MNIFGEQIFVHLILHIYKQIKKNNTCPPCPHTINMFGQEHLFTYWKNILGEKTFVHLVLALVGHVLAVVEGAVDRGAAVKEVADL